MKHSDKNIFNKESKSFLLNGADDGFVVITYPCPVPNELEQILKLLKDRNCRLHLRKPDYSEFEYEAILQAIPPEFYSRLVLHDYFHLTEKYEVGGIHLSTKKRTEVDVKKLTLRKGITVSTSCHSIAELKEIDGIFDYAFLSPVFPSISKPGYCGNLEMTAVENYLKQENKTKVVALGGVDESKINQLKEWGFDGYAMLGNVWQLTGFSRIKKK